MDVLQARAALEQALIHVAPEIDIADVDLEADLRDELDLDSLDFLNLATRLEELTGIRIPEDDYPRLDSLTHCIQFLVDRSAVAPA